MLKICVEFRNNDEDDFLFYMYICVIVFDILLV